MTLRETPSSIVLRTPPHRNNAPQDIADLHNNMLLPACYDAQQTFVLNRQRQMTLLAQNSSCYSLISLCNNKSHSKYSSFLLTSL